MYFGPRVTAFYIKYAKVRTRSGFDSKSRTGAFCCCFSGCYEGQGYHDLVLRILTQWLEYLSLTCIICIRRHSCCFVMFRNWLYSKNYAFQIYRLLLPRCGEFTTKGKFSFEQITCKINFIYWDKYHLKTYSFI